MELNLLVKNVNRKEILKMELIAVHNVNMTYIGNVYLKE